MVGVLQRTGLEPQGIGSYARDRRFGTGYSCLSYLPSLPFDALKIDRSFIQELDLTPEGEAMVHSLITLAQNIGMRVIVEGIEKADQVEIVRQLGGHETQGFLLGRPRPDPARRFCCSCRTGQENRFDLKPRQVNLFVLCRISKSCEEVVRAEAMIKVATAEQWITVVRAICRACEELQPSR